MIESKIELLKPYMRDKESAFIKSVLNSYKPSTVSQVDAFEKAIASYAGVKDAIAVHSSASAIHLALILLGVQKGDQVYCPTLTSSVNIKPILHQGAEPVWIDSEKDTWSMSPLALRRALHLDALKGSLPKAVIVSNTYGQSARMNELFLVCDYYRVPIIEDATESFGSMYKGRMSGTLGKFGIYSFSEDKIITAYGGGILVSDDTSLMNKARDLIGHTCGRMLGDESIVLGFDYRLNHLLASIGRNQLQVIDQQVEKKRDIFRRYAERLADLPGIRMMPELNHTMSNRWITTLTIDEHLAGLSASQLIYILNEKMIEACPLRKPLHMHAHLRHYPYYAHKELEHVAKKLFESGICLPSGPNLTKEEQDMVIETIRTTIKMVQRNRVKIKKYEVLT